MKVDERLAEIRESWRDGNGVDDDEMDWLFSRVAELEPVLKKCKRVISGYRRGGLQPLLDEVNEVLDES